MRLDIHLAKKYPQYSRSHLQKLIKAGKVLVNGKIVSPHYQINKGGKRDSRISFSENIIPPEKIDLSPDKSIKLDIVYDDENYLVINKPDGLVVHPSESVKSHTLVNAILAYYPPIKNIGDQKNNNNYQLSQPQPKADGPLAQKAGLLQRGMGLWSKPLAEIINYRPGIIHRLDKDVSGLMVIAKTQAAFDDLKRQFQGHEIKKKYTCLVHGNVKKDSGEINIPIGRSKKGYKMSAQPTGQARSSDRAPKQATTKFKVLQRFKNFTLLKIQTLTGRTHQIRVHLQAIGHPIVGDPIYKSRNQEIKKSTLRQTQGGEKQEIKIDAPRLFLHADLLEFHDLKNQPKKFKLELPEELKNLLKSYNE
ncbi:RluA family pseudouridine synthase [Patescibacteria group bacterium]|nr:RluA family pseudouridine synthase [Patescibacteria group bacterium]MBU4511651.1 RluA family pseudouridine synthase [Patescibacteria group bacterium]